MNLTKTDLATLISLAGIQSELSKTEANPAFLQIVGLYATAPNSEKLEMLLEFQSLAEQFTTNAHVVLAKVSTEIESLKAKA